MGDLFAPVPWPVVNANGPGFTLSIGPAVTAPELRQVIGLAEEVLAKRFPGEVPR
jgi:hypothetical protein